MYFITQTVVVACCVVVGGGASVVQVVGPCGVVAGGAYDKRDIDLQSIEIVVQRLANSPKQPLVSLSHHAAKTTMAMLSNHHANKP